MALLPTVTFVLEGSGDTVMVVPGNYSLPALDTKVWLGAVGESLVRYKVEDIDQYYTPIEGQTIGGQTRTSVNGSVTITVSVVP